jgi:hypothetical protein
MRSITYLLLSILFITSFFSKANDFEDEEGFVILDTAGVQADEESYLDGEWTEINSSDCEGGGQLLPTVNRESFVHFSKVQEAWHYEDMAYKRQFRPDHKQDIFEAELTKGTSITFFGDNQGIVFTKKCGSVVVAYQGTTNLRDIMTDLSFRGYYSQKTGLSGHSGFLKRYEQTKDQLFLILESIAHEQGKKLIDLDLLFTGHSLGGALAQIAAADATINHQLGSELITFAAPRALSVTSVEDALLTNRIINPVLIVSKYDYVHGILPEFLTGYRGLGTKITVGNVSDINQRYNPASAHKMGDYALNLPELESSIASSVYKGETVEGCLNLSRYMKEDSYLRLARTVVHRYGESPVLFVLSWVWPWRG